MTVSDPTAFCASHAHAVAELLGETRQAEFDGLAGATATMFGCPIGAISVVECNRQWFKAVTDPSICEIPVEHPSCSRQHAALQFRAVKITKPSGRTVLSVRPYIIDLESANGTYLNNEKIQPRRFTIPSLFFPFSRKF